MTGDDLRKFIRDIPDFPRKGIVFKDITPLLGNRSAFRKAVDLLADPYRDRVVHRVVGIESRGFIVGAAVAYVLGTAFAPVRKTGKLPYLTHRATYQLEYGSDVIEIHRDAIQPGEKVLIVDDLLATGGTAAAVIELVNTMKGEIIGCAFLTELTFLEGRKRLAPYPVYSLICF